MCESSHLMDPFHLKYCFNHLCREYYWANYSTGLGASLHELGHTFDLAHTPTGVMARGFDDLYRVFITQPMTHLCRAVVNGLNRLGSPIPYSPRQSPLCRSRVSDFRGFEIPKRDV